MDNGCIFQYCIPSLNFQVIEDRISWPACHKSLANGKWKCLLHISSLFSFVILFLPCHVSDSIANYCQFFNEHSGWINIVLVINYYIRAKIKVLEAIQWARNYYFDCYTIGSIFVTFSQDSINAILCHHILIQAKFHPEELGRYLISFPP